MQRRHLFTFVGHRLRGPQDYDGSVVEGVMKRGPCQNQTVHERHGHADRNSFGQGAQHAAGRRPVNEKLVSNPSVAGRDDKWLSVHCKPDVTDEGFIKDRVYRVAVERAAFRQPFECRVG